MSDRLDKALRVAGVSNQEMAEALDVSRNTISNYTSGRTKPSRLQLKEWSLRTGAPLEWILTGDETAPGWSPGPSLPGLDSNQEPIGFQPAGELIYADFAA